MDESQKRIRRVDVAVIGAGTAGLAAYRAAMAAGRCAVLIEGGNDGTTCARVGCMPSKLLLAAAEVAHHARHAGPFGVHTSVRVDGCEVMHRVRHERDRFVDLVLRDMDSIPAEDRIRGHARFVAMGELAVGDRRVVARSVVLATGSSPVVPKMFEGLGDRVVVSDDVFEWTDLPESVAVFGAGAVGLELGQALARLGVRVQVFGRDGDVAGIGDPDVKAVALRAFRDTIDLDADAKVLRVVRGASGVAVRCEEAGGKETVRSFAYALVAAGRRPNVQGLDLSAAGLALSGEGVPLHDTCTLQCGDSPVFIAGDASDDTPVLHEAVDQGRAAGENAARFPEVLPRRRKSRLTIVFTDPQVAIVGAGFPELEPLLQRGDVVTGEVSFEDQGRSRILLQNRGLLHLYADARTGLFLGAEVAGPCAEHLAHLLAWAHQQELSVARMLSMPIYHPVVEEGLRTALLDAQAKLAERASRTTHPSVEG